MKIKKISANLDTFRTVLFKNDFNVIVGDPIDTQDGRSHNLGKTTLLRIIKYVLFNGKGDFLKPIKKKHPNLIFSITYYDNETEKIFSRSFSKRQKGEPQQIETSISYEYFIRLQDEFDIANPFRKTYFIGKDSSWKPRLAGLLGFDDTLLSNKLKLADEIKELEKAIKSLKNVNISQGQEQKEIESLESQKKSIEESLNKLELFRSDNMDLNILVQEIDSELYKIRPNIYELKTEKRKIENTLNSLPNLSFNTEKIEKIFSEVNLYFESQIKKDIADLNDFYNYLFLSRKLVIQNRKNIIDMKLTELEMKANELDERRSIILNQLINKNHIDTYNGKYKELIEIEKRLALLKQNKKSENIKKLEEQLEKKKTEHFQIAAEVSLNISSSKSKFNQINKIYSYIMKEVLKINAEIVIEIKTTGNIDIFTKSYKRDNETEELKGDTAKKISAAAVDLAIRCVQNDDSGFIVQDGVIDNLDNNTAFAFITVVKELVNQYHFQYIMTALKEKLPNNVTPDDIRIIFNDKSEQGLLMGFSY